MIPKLILKLQNMKAQTFLALLLILLTACAPAVTPAPTETLLPSAVPPTSTATADIIPAATTPSPLPTQPIVPLITPDAIQVARWKEYQAELAKLVLSEAGDIFPDYESALCEWDILGRSDQEVYVWAECIGPNAAGRKPAVVYLEADGLIRKVRVAGYKGLFFDLGWFPADVREKITLYYSSSCTYCGRPEELRMHLQYRQTHPEVPPLNVLSAMPTATTTP